MIKVSDRMIYVGNDSPALKYGDPCILVEIDKDGSYTVKIKRGSVKNILADAFIKYTLEEYTIIHLEMLLKAKAAEGGNLDAFDKGELNTIARRIVTGIPF